MPDAPPERSSLAALAEIDLIRRRVLNVVGHELRTPITTVRGLTELLATADLATIRAEIAPRLVSNMRRLEHIVDDVLVASGVTTALPVGRFTSEAVAPVLTAAWAAVSPDAPISVIGDLDACALLPPGSLGRVLTHVLGNVAAYGRAPVTATITSGSGTTVVTVAAGGTAPPDEELRLAFEPFFRGEAAVMTGPGLGLGLTVARALVEQVGGWVTLAAGRPDGTVTTVEMPAA